MKTYKSLLIELLTGHFFYAEIPEIDMIQSFNID